MTTPISIQRFRPSVAFLRSAGILVLAMAMVGAIPVPTKSDFDGRPRYNTQEIRRAIAFYAKRYRLDPALLRAVIKTESDFRPDAVSRKGAIGLMQLTPETAATLRVGNLHDPIQNIGGGAKQLRHLLNLYEGDLRLTLAAYNAGVHRVKGGRIPRIRETRRYVRKVLKHYEMYRSKSPDPAAPNHASKVSWMTATEEATTISLSSPVRAAALVEP